MIKIDKRQIRDGFRFVSAIFFCVIYIPHIIFYITKIDVINCDLEKLRKQIKFKLPLFLTFLYFLHNNSYFRCLFYYRIGPVKSLFISWYRPGNSSFIIPYSTKIGKGMCFAHPFSTVLNAESIGKDFYCIHCTTIGKKNALRPIIGDNVSIGCNVCIIGGIHIGNNVTIGAGSIVIKDVPDNCVVAGNPAKVIKYIEVLN